MTKDKVLVIVGPTASGKSDLAVRLAKKFGGEIISADSRQVYKGLNIGTGKITKKEMMGIPHHLLDVAEPKNQFTASEFALKATEAIEAIKAREAVPIIAGGTGFYIDTLSGTTSLPDVPPNPKLRKKLSAKSADELFEILKKKAPRRAKTIDKHNKVRLIRALEIVAVLGSVPVLKPESYKLEAKNFVFIGLKPDDLDERIAKRLKKRLPGIIREAKKLFKLNKLTYKRMHELGLEYRYAGLHLQGKITKKEMGEKLFTEIRHYAKRQMTWFKRNKKIKWFTPSSIEGFRPDEYREIEAYLTKHLQ